MAPDAEHILAAAKRHVDRRLDVIEEQLRRGAVVIAAQAEEIAFLRAQLQEVYGQWPRWLH